MNRSDGGRFDAFDILRPFNRLVFFGGALFSSIGMAAMLVAGFWEMLSSILIFFGALPIPVGHSSRSGAALELATKSLEFFFVAPLAYALMIGVARYVEATTSRNAGVAEQGCDSRLRRIESARSDLLVVKAFSASLFIAIFAAILLGKALGEEGIQLETAISCTLVILVLSIYLFILEHSSSEVRSYLAHSSNAQIGLEKTSVTSVEKPGVS